MPARDNYLRPLCIRARHLVRKGRGTSLLICGCVAALAGLLCVLMFAKNLSAAGQAHEGFGHVYRIALPKGVTRLEDVRIFEVVTTGADDFLRAELNGHSVLNSEDPQEALIRIAQGPNKVDEDAEKLIEKYVVDRKTKLMNRRPAELALVRGSNQLIVELENYRGPCGGGVQIFVNEQPIGGVPTALPLRAGPDDQLLPVPHKEHALCARVAYQFELQ